MLYSKFYDFVLEASSHMSSLSDVINVSYPFHAKPLPIVTCFKGDISSARLSNFRIRLLLHCPALNKDTAVFHLRANKSRDPLCSLCHSAVEDAHIAILHCHPLSSHR